MAKRCPKCAALFPDERALCPKDGEVLLAAGSGQTPPPRPPDPLDATASGPPPPPSGLSGDDLTGDTLVGGGEPTPHGRSGRLLGSDEDDLGPGAMLGSLYRVVRRIGEGGMGTVYEVEHVRMRKRFAAKVLRSELSTREHIRRLEREAITAGSIDHPNILQIVNLDETPGGRVFLVCELLEGHDLARLICEGPVDLSVAFRIVVSIASALARTHAEGIIHRDLKPENVFLHGKEGDVVVKVLDFGVSKMDAGEEGIRLTEAGAVLGTPAYMSPEGTEGRTDLDRRADVYSLGVILYEMATGDLPFSGSSAVDVMIKHVNDPLEPPTARRPGLPPGLDGICLKAMAKSPDERYQSMDELADAVRALAEELGLPEATIPMLPAGEGTGLRSTPSARGSGSGRQDPEARGKLWLLAAAAVAVTGLVVTLLLGTRSEPAPGAEPQRPAAASAPAPAAQQGGAIDLLLETTPPGAEVRAGDERLGVTPVTVRLARGTGELELTFSLDGYEAETRAVVPDRAQALVLELRKKERPRPKRPKRPAAKAPKVLGTR